MLRTCILFLPFIIGATAVDPLTEGHDRAMALLLGACTSRESPRAGSIELLITYRFQLPFVRTDSYHLAILFSDAKRTIKESSKGIALNDTDEQPSELQ